MAAAGVLPASQRAVWPTNPCASVPGDPRDGFGTGRTATSSWAWCLIDVDGDSSDGVVVTVVVSGDGDGDGTASLVCDAEPPPWSPKTSTEARTTAAVNITAVAATSATCVGPNRDFVPGGQVADGRIWLLVARSRRVRVDRGELPGVARRARRNRRGGTATSRKAPSRQPWPVRRPTCTCRWAASPCPLATTSSNRAVDSPAHDAGPRRRREHVRTHHLPHIARLERRTAGEALVQQARQGVDVGGRAAAAAAEPFGGHVGARADNQSGARHIRLTAAVRDAEVDQISEVVGREQHVLRLDVAVHEAVAVRSVQRGRDLPDDRHRTRRRERAH